MDSFRDAKNQIEIKNGKMSFNVRVAQYNEDFTQEAIETVKRQSFADQNLDETVINRLENIRLEQYPLIASDSSCAHLAAPNSESLSDLILSRAYGSNCQSLKSLLQSVLALQNGANHYAGDVLHILGSGIAQGDAFPFVESKLHELIDGATYYVSRKDPLKFVYCPGQEELRLHSAHLKKTIGGYYSPKYNVVTFSGNDTDGHFAPYFIHEAAHAAINIRFRNEAKPYFADNPTQKADYERAEREVFKNIAIKLGVPAELVADLDATSKIIDVISDECPSSKRSKLILSEYDQTILSAIDPLIQWSLSFENVEDIRAAETIVRIPQLLAQGLPLEIVQAYFKPLMDYWDREIKVLQE